MQSWCFLLDQTLKYHLKEGLLQMENGGHAIMHLPIVVAEIIMTDKHESVYYQQSRKRYALNAI